MTNGTMPRFKHHIEQRSAAAQLRHERDQARAVAEQRRANGSTEAMTAATAATLDESRRRIAAALATRCDDHDAKPGTHCWGSRLSGVTGICNERYLRGLRGPVSARPTAVAARIPDAARIALERRHPNRHPVRPAKTEAAR